MGDQVDFSPVLIDYFIEKGILFRNETNWSEIVKDERFKGTTAHYLMKIYSQLVGNFKRANPDIEDDDITSEKLRQYLDHRSRKQKKDHRKLFEDYVDIK